MAPFLEEELANELEASLRRLAEIPQMFLEQGGAGKDGRNGNGRGGGGGGVGVVEAKKVIGVISKVLIVPR